MPGGEFTRWDALRWSLKVRLNRLSRWRATFLPWRRLATLILVIPIAVYLYSEIGSAVLVIEPLSLPKSLQDRGLTPDVMAGRIGNAINDIETLTRVHTPRNEALKLSDIEPAPEIEIPGLKMSLQNGIDLVRRFLGNKSVHIRGDVEILNASDPDHPGDAVVTLYISRGEGRPKPLTFLAKDSDEKKIIEGAAKAILDRINPYLLGAYYFQNRQIPEASKIAERLASDETLAPEQREHGEVLWGVIQISHQQFAEAQRHYETAIKLNPKDPYAHFGLGNALYSQKELEAARREYHAALACDRHHFGSLGMLGVTYLSESKYKEALIPLQAAVTMHTASVEIFALLGQTYAHLNRYPEANQSFATAFKLNPQDAATLSGWADVMARQHKHASAIVLYERALSLDPTEGFTHYALANEEKALQHYGEAIAEYQRATKLKPTDWGFRLLGEAQATINRYQDAAAAYSQAAKLKPEEASSFWQLGNVQMELKCYTDAAANFSQALKLDGNSVDALVGRAHLSLATGSPPEVAEVDTLRAIQLKPDSVVARAGHGDVLLRLHRDQEAIAEYQKAQKESPDWPGTYDGLGDTYRDQGQYAQASEAYRHALKLYAYDAPAHSGLGSTLSAEGDSEGAIREFKIALDLDPGQLDALAAWAQLLVSKKQFREAERKLRIAIALDPTRHDIRFSLVKLLRQRDRESEARAIERQHPVPVSCS